MYLMYTSMGQNLDDISIVVAQGNPKNLGFTSKIVDFE